MALTAGTRLGPYEIGAQLGAGGMGEVYRATDTRLDRTVAIKVLPQHLADEPQRRERFEREAKAVSSLNHPHICTLHDVGEQDGIHYLVMEYVEGDTLQQRLEKGRLPLDQALEYSIQIADALDKAHRQGVVHRDLKPGNIMITKSAGVKLLDFGLAKLKGDAGHVSPLSQLPTQDASAPLTAEGTILGTLQYMAPEQLEGKEADARTDIFAFGAVVYEIVTGKKAFEGSSQASLIAAIIERQPPAISEQQVLAPSALDRLVRTCLAKDPDDRWQSMADLCRELEWLSRRETVDVQAIKESRSRSNKIQTAMIVALLLVVSVIAISYFSESDPLQSSTAGQQVRQQLTYQESASKPSLSPDGEFLAYGVADCSPGAACRAQLMVKDLAGGDPISLGPEISFDGQELRPNFFWSIEWSPDGQELLFTARYNSNPELSGVYRIPRLGGFAERVATEGVVTSAAYRFDGETIDWIAKPEGLQAQSVMRTKQENSEVVTRTLPIRATHHQWSPDGQWLALVGAPGFGFFRSGPEVVIMSPSFEIADKIQIGSATEGWPHVRWHPSGNAIYLMVEGDLLRVEIDESSGTFLSTEEVVSGVEPHGLRQSEFDVSRDGLSFVHTLTRERIEIRALEASNDGLTMSVLAGGMTWRDFPALSPDGEIVAYVREDQLGSNIYVVPFRGGVERALTATANEKTHPRWSPDGSQLAYVALEDEAVWLNVTASVPGQIEQIARLYGADTPPFAWYPDSERLLFVDESGRLSIATLGEEDVQHLMALSDTPGIGWGVSVEPNSESVAVFNHGLGVEAGLPIWLDVASLATTASKWTTVFRSQLENLVTSTQSVGSAALIGWVRGGLHGWMPDGRLLLLHSRSEGVEVSAGVWAIPVDGGTPEQLLDLSESCGAPTWGSLTLDLRRIVCAYRQSEMDIWLISSFDGRQ